VATDYKGDSEAKGCRGEATRLDALGAKQGVSELPRPYGLWGTVFWPRPYGLWGTVFWPRPYGLWGTVF